MQPATQWDYTTAVNWYYFFAKFEIGDPAECWEWQAMRDEQGYGKFSIRRSDGVRWFRALAHRLSFAFFNGPIPEGHCVCHRCDNPPCVNPHHLFAGTLTENALDSVAKGRNVRGDTHGRARLDSTQVKDIRDKYLRGGISHRELATEYGVCQATIWYVLNDETWKNA